MTPTVDINLGAEYSGYTRRWYDDTIEIVHAIYLLESLPEKLVQVVSQGIIEVAEKELEINEAALNRKTLGIDKLLPMYQAMANRRSYDNYPTLQKVVKYLHLLSEPNRLFLCGQVVELVGHIKEYLKRCQTFDSEPDADDVLNMTTKFVENGGKEVQELLASLEQKFAQAVKKAVQKANPRAGGKSGKANIDSSGDDMRIRS